jgi:hypothetical protein
MFAGTSSVTFVRSVRYVLVFLIEHLDLSGNILWQGFVAKTTGKNERDIIMCSNKIGLCAQNIFKKSRFNHYHCNWEGLCDH